MQSGSHYLGIEGGGTRSTLVLADEHGHAIAELNGGPANLKLLSDRQLIWLLRSFAARLPAQHALTAICIGLAGARSDSDRERIRNAAARVWPRVPCLATNDLDTALASAPEHKDAAARVLILSGTGSCCFGKTSDGRAARIGGRGHIIGDRGSACDIGQRALKALMTEYDRSGRWPKLGQLVLSVLLLNEPDDLIPWSMVASKTDLAAIAVSVFTAAQARDPLAKQLLDEAASVLAADALTCAQRLCKPSERVQFVLNGGVLLKNASFARDIAKCLRAKYPQAIITPVRGASSWGAVALAKAFAQGKASSPAKLVTQPAIPGLPLDHPAFDKALLRSSPTEQRSTRSLKLDTMPLAQAVDLMLDDDAGITQALHGERARIVWVIKKIIAAFQQGGRLFYVGAGTSGRLGVLDASECPPTFRAPREQVQGIIAGGTQALWSAVEGAEDDAAAGAQAIVHRGIAKHDVVIGIAASGRTPFVWGALAQAASRGATTVLVCFHPGFKKLRRRAGLFLPNQVIAPDLGPELLTGSTRLKCGTATKQLLNLFTTLAMTRTGKVVSNLMVDLNPSNVKLRARAIGIVQLLTGCSQEAAREALERCGWVVKEAWQRLR
jgi:N-acetylmuramic acid 6-phosphate etherase